jgi:hypothetical protein
VSDRKTPILLRAGPLTGSIFAITRYTRVTQGEREIINAQIKQDVTDDFRCLLLERLLGEHTGLQLVLEKVRNHEELTSDEREQVGYLADRLREDIEAVAS